MCKGCNNCEGFIPKSTERPFNAFDYMSGNKVGVCNFTESVTALFVIEKNCELWEMKKTNDSRYKYNCR